MSVNPSKPRKVIVVHGVQTGENDDQNQHINIKTLIEQRKGQLPLNFTTEMFRYEDVNDEALQLFKTAAGAIASTPINGVVAQTVIDLVGDVVLSLQNGSAAAAIRERLKEQILANYEDGNPCYIVAHSLGSIYAFDVVNQLVAEPDLFARNSRKSWPVQGLMTLGSPIGLPMFSQRGRESVMEFGEGNKWFRWVNFWDRTDPVVSGNIFGSQLQEYSIAEKYQTDSQTQGWVIRDNIVDTGKVWLSAHTAYWDNAIVGDALVELVAN